MTLLDLLRHPDIANGDPNVKHLLVDWARELIRESDRQWDAVADNRNRIDDAAAEFHRGKAHALCGVTGDQQALRSFI